MTSDHRDLPSADAHELARRLGPLESAVMDVLWAATTELRVREVLAHLEGRELAYTTVMTVLDNLHRKGWVERRRDGRAYCYRPRSSREDHVASLMADALSGAADQRAVLTRFVEAMSIDEAAALRLALDARPQVDR